MENGKKSLNYRKSKKTKSDFVEKRFESDQMLELISNFIHLSLSQNNLSAVRSVPRCMYLRDSLNQTKIVSCLLFKWVSELQNGICPCVGWIPGFFGVSTSFSKSRIWLAQIVELQKSFEMIPNSNRFPGYWIAKIIFLVFVWAFG